MGVWRMEIHFEKARKREKRAKRERSGGAIINYNLM
jgi:hypothetical protein